MKGCEKYMDLRGRQDRSWRKLYNEKFIICALHWLFVIREIK
jgi:hypothetical protein